MTFKSCTKCNEEKLLSEFRRDRNLKDGYRSECKICSRLLYKQRYDAGVYSVKVIEQNRHRRTTSAAFVQRYKRLCSCKYCDENESCCLEFHHKDPTTKLFSVGGAGNRTINQIKEEIRKCICICSNCHKKLHAGIIQP